VVAGERVLEGGGLRAEGEDAGPIEQVVLDLIERRQKALAEGVGEAVEQSENIFATAAATQIKSFTNKAVSATKTLFGDISDNVQKAFEETRKRNEAIADLNKRYAEESEQIEQERVDALIRTTNQALEVADIRQRRYWSVHFLGCRPGKIPRLLRPESKAVAFKKYATRFASLAEQLKS